MRPAPRKSDRRTVQINSSGFMVTVMNPQKPSREMAQALFDGLRDVEYILYAEDVAPTTGTPHYHIYVKLSRSYNISGAMIEALLGQYGHLSLVEWWIILYLLKKLLFGYLGITAAEVENLRRHAARFDGIANSKHPPPSAYRIADNPLGFQANPDVSSNDSQPEQRSIEVLTGDSFIGVKKSKNTGTVQGVVKMLNEGASVESIVLHSPFSSWAANNISKVHQIKALLDNNKAKLESKKNRLVWSDIKIDLASFRPFEIQLAKVFNYWSELFARRDRGENVKFDGRCHLFIWGKTRTGKSRVMEMFSRFWASNKWNKHGSEWQDSFDMDAYWVLVEEFRDDSHFHNKAEISKWNEIMDGRHIYINQRHKAPLVISEMMPFCFITNQNPSFMFSETDDESRRAFWSRFFVVQVSDEIRLLSHLWDDNRYRLANFYDNNDASTKLVHTATNTLIELSGAAKDNLSEIVADKAVADILANMIED